MLPGKLGADKPAGGKLFPCIGHVLAAKYAEPQHLPGRQFRLELRIELAAHGRTQRVAVAFLHLVGDDNYAFAHHHRFAELGADITLSSGL